VGEFSEAVEAAVPEDLVLFGVGVEEEGGVEGENRVAGLGGELEDLFEFGRVVLEGVEEVEPVVVLLLLAGEFVGVVDALA
jgi:hypothetical protein